MTFPYSNIDVQRGKPLTPLTNKPLLYRTVSCPAKIPAKESSPSFQSSAFKLTRLFQLEGDSDLLEGTIPSPVVPLEEETVEDVFISEAKKIGEGGWYTVYYTEANIAHKGMMAIALRVLKDARNHEEPKREHQLLTRLMNAIPRTYDTIYIPDSIGYTNEYHLEEYLPHSVREIASRGPLHLAKVQAIARRIILAIEFLHEQNVVHCDICPDNIALKSTSTSGIKIIDFSLSCEGPGPFRYALITKRSYRAPEIVRKSSQFTNKVDIFSLACTIYELAAGEPLFRVRCDEDLERLHANHLPTLSKKRILIPAELESKLTKLYVTQCRTFPHSEQVSKIVELFAAFRSMLELCLLADPDTRPTAYELIKLPFFTCSEKDRNLL